MVLQLAMQWFPQCVAGGTLQRFVVPVPWKTPMPVRVQQYVDCTWRTWDMSLAEYMRKANKKGEIAKYLRKRYAIACAEVDGNEIEDLEPWAATAQTRGEFMTASIYLSRYNDEYYGQWVLMNVPFTSVGELWREDLDLVPGHLRCQALALLHRPEHWQDQSAIRADLELEAFREHHIRNILAMLLANQIHIQNYFDGTLDKDDELPAQVANRDDPPPLAEDQKRIASEIGDSVKAGMQAKQVRETYWMGEHAMDESPFGGVLRYAFAVLGPAGSGKSVAVQSAVDKVFTDLEGRILIVAPTGRLAATYRAKFPHLDVDTIHGAFKVYKPMRETMELMMPYDLVVVEEVGQLSRPIFDRLIQLWTEAERLPTLVFVGDFWQLPGVDPTKATDSLYWRGGSILKRELHTMRRCKCEKLRAKLQILRSAKPDMKQLRFILRGHKAPSRGRVGYCMNKTPTATDVWHILQETPHTMFLTVSRRACAMLNKMAVQALFSDDTPIAVEVPCDPESNTENYDGSSKTRSEPILMSVFLGMSVVLTKNLNKSIGFVNGMGAKVLGVDRHRNILVITEQGIRISLHPYTEEDGAVYFPMRLGYASTLHKVQGATLKHVTIWLDVRNMSAAAYVALSRVEYDANWRFVGDPGRHHFTPARFF
jgi:hypothetical protein